MPVVKNSQGTYQVPKEELKGFMSVAPSDSKIISMNDNAQPRQPVQVQRPSNENWHLRITNPQIVNQRGRQVYQHNNPYPTKTRVNNQTNQVDDNQSENDDNGNSVTTDNNGPIVQPDTTPVAPPAENIQDVENTPPPSYLQQPTQATPPAPIAQTNPLSNYQPTTGQEAENQLQPQVTVAGQPAEPALTPLATQGNGLGQSLEQTTGKDAPSNEQLLQSQITSLQNQADQAKDIYAQAVLRQQVQDLQDKATQVASQRFDALTKNNPAALQSFGGLMNLRNLDPSYASAEAALGSLEESKKTIDQVARQNAGAGIASNILSGLKDAITGQYTYTTGQTIQAANALATLQAIQRQKQGKASYADNLALTSAAVKQAVDQSYGNQIGLSYNAGLTTGQSIPYMAEFLLNPGESVGDAVTKNLATYTLKKFGSSEILKKVASTSARLIGDAVKAVGVEATFGGSRAAADAVQRHIGNIQTKVNNHGYTEYAGTQGGDSTGKAIGKSILNEFINDYSEMFGEYFHPAANAIKGVAARAAASTIGKKLVLNKVADFLTKASASDFSKAISSFEKQARWNGAVGEFGEEFIGNAMNAATVGDQSWADVVDPKQNLNTFLSVSLMSGFFSAVHSVGYFTGRRQARNLLNRSDINGFNVLGGDWQSFKTDIDNSDMDNLKAYGDGIKNTEYLNQKEKAGILGYIGAKTFANGYNIADLKKKTEGDLDNNQMTGEASYDQGLTTTDPQEKADTKLRLQVVSDQVDTSKLDAMPGTPAQKIQALRDMDVSEDKVQAAINYFNLSAKYNGMIHAAQDNISQTVDANNQQIDGITHVDGNVYSATDHSDNPINVLSGKIGFDQNGEVDPKQSDDTVVIKDSDGQMQMVPINDISINSIELADQMKQRVGEGIYSQLSEQLADEINGKRDFQPGEQYSVLVSGKPMNVQVTQVTPDGIVFTDGHTSYISTPDQLNEYADAKSMQDIQAENEQQTKQIQQQEEQKNQQVEMATPDYWRSKVGETVNIGGKDYTINEGYENNDKNGKPAPAFALFDENGQMYQKQPLTADNLADIVNNPPVEQPKEQKPATPKEIVDDLNSKMPAEQVQTFIQNNIDSAQKKLTAAQNKKNTATDRENFLQNEQNKQSDINNAQAELNYYQSLMNEVQPQQKDAQSKEVDYTSMTPDEAVYDMRSKGLSDEVIKNYADGQKSLLKEDLSNLKKQEPKKSEAPKLNRGESPLDFNARHQAWQEDYKKRHDAWQKQVDDLKQKSGVWNSISNYKEDIFNKPIADINKELGESVSPEDEVYRALSQGHLLRWSDKNGDKGLGSELGMSEEERRKRISLLSNEGYTPSGLAQYLKENDDEHAFDNVSEQDIRNMIIDAVRSNNSTRDMINSSQKLHDSTDFKSSEIKNLASELGITPKELESMYGELLQKASEDGVSPKDYYLYKDKADALGTDVKDYVSYIGYLDSELDALTPEQHDDILNEIDNEYNRIREELPEGQGSDASNERSSEVLQGTEHSDNQGQERGTESAEPVSTKPNEEQIKEARKDVDTNPTDAQKEAGNYKKGHVKIDGMDVTIENPSGSIRRGVSEDGKAWETSMHNDYGYIRGTTGVDGDHVDVYLSSHPDSGNVYVVDQVNPKTGEFDEHKVMYGFDSKDDAEKAYLSNYEKGWKGLGNITEVSKDDFKKWLGSSKRKTKAFADYKSISKLSGGTDENIATLSNEEDKTPQKIEDFGEKIGGAKKDLAKERMQRSLDASDDDILSQPLSKIFPRPIFEKLSKEGVPNDAVALMRIIYSTIPHKPQSRYKLSSYLSTVRGVIALFDKIINNKEDSSHIMKVMSESPRLRSLVEQAETLLMVGFPHSGLDSTGYRVTNETISKDGKQANKWLLHDKRKYKIFESQKDAVDSLKNILSSPKDNKVEFSIYQRRNDGTCFIAPKGKSNIIIQDGFKSSKDASEYFNSHLEELTSKWNDMRALPSDRIRENRERNGKDWLNGEEATPEKFSDQFGFRGVEFGNWVNQSERQQALKDAYNSLMDLSEIIGVSPKALSLDKSLGIAFGARGGGSANAHYEPDKVVINLTKTRGAGSLAHEWWHALDNYLTHSNSYASDSSKNLREELSDAMKHLTQVIENSEYSRRSRHLDNIKNRRYWGTKVELTARAFENYVFNKMAEHGDINDYLANFASTDEFIRDSNGNLDKLQNNYPYPMNEESKTIDNAYDKFFNTLQEKVDDETGSHILYRDAEPKQLTDHVDSPNEEQQIIENSKKAGTYLKAPNGKDTNLSPKQWTQVRTNAFKKWFGDWEKISRLEKLKQSSPIEITGKEITPSEDLKQYKKNAIEYGKSLRGDYTNKDTGETINIALGTNRGGIKEILNHDYKDKEQIQSIAAVPKIIENSIFIDEVPNEDVKKNPNISSYRYYVCGLKIGGEDYTVRAAIAVNKDGSRYYDHKLSKIEKGKLLILSGLSSMGESHPADKEISLSDIKDKRLSSILQINSSKIVDENGEPMVVYHGTNWNPMNEKEGYASFINNRGTIWFTGNRKRAEGYSFNNGEKGNIIEVYLDIKNPAVKDSYINDPKSWNGDGYISYADYAKNYKDKFFSIVVDNPNQIKSATGNKGTFSSEDPDIRFRETEAQSKQLNDQVDSSVKSIAESLNTPIKQVTNEDDLTDRQKHAKGWFNSTTGEVVVNMDNADSPEDVQRTILHETVGHYGLRNLLGNNFTPLLDSVWKNDAIRNSIIERFRNSGGDFTKFDQDREVDEYMARMAENATDQNLWHYVCDQVRSAIASAKIKLGFRLSDNDIRSLIQASYSKLKNGKIDLTYSPEKILYRGKDANEVSHRTATRMYEQIVGDKWFRLGREGFVDNMASLKVLIDSVLKERNEKLQEWEDPYTAENHVSSINKVENEMFNETYMKPIFKAVADMQKTGMTYNQIVNYLIEKHGLERNIIQSFRDAVEEERNQLLLDALSKGDNSKDTKDKIDSLINGKYDSLYKFRDELESSDKDLYKKNQELKDFAANLVPEFEYKDRSGISSIFKNEEDEENNEDGTWEDKALDSVNDIESSYDTKPLWDYINDATKKTLEKAFKSGTISKSQYNNTKRMFVNYIPLRGFKEDVASDVYEYFDDRPQNFAIGTIKTARGRVSLADDPLATIGAVGQRTISDGNRNLVNQKLYNFAVNHPSKLLGADRMWYINAGTKQKPVWKESYPDIPENSTADQATKIRNEWLNEMRQKQEEGTATQRPNGINLKYVATNNEKSQHDVQVRLNGESYTVHVNGNPRAAQALNGMIRNSSDWVPRKILRYIMGHMAMFFTTANPAFVVRNLAKDMEFASNAVFVKESSSYFKKWMGNAAIGGLNQTLGMATAGYAGGKMKIISLMRKFQKNELDMNNPMEKYFHEFMTNGGETGYTNINTIEEYKTIIDKEIKKLTRSKGKDIAMKPVDLLNFVGNGIELANRCAEDVTRFNTYLTSRQMGRSIITSVDDAKNITVNFNKKGSGAGLAGWCQDTMLFFNAGVQSLKLQKDLWDASKFKFMLDKSFLVALGACAPIISKLIINGAGSGDDSEYDNIPSWIRENDLTISLPFGKSVSIPISIEDRSFYGLGEKLYHIVNHTYDKTPEEGALDILGQFLDVLPVNMLQGNNDASLSGMGMALFVPDVAKPIAQVMVNKDYFGKKIHKDSYNELEPEYTKVYSGTNKELVNASKILNNISGGNEHSGGFMNINPADVEHIFTGYLGGTFSTINQAVKTALMINDPSQRQYRNLPIVSSFLQSPSDDMNQFGAVNERYYDIDNKMRDVKNQISGFSKDEEKGIIDSSKELTKIYNSKNYKMYEVYQDWEKVLESDRKSLKDATSDSDRKMYELSYNMDKASFLKDIDKIK